MPGLLKQIGIRPAADPGKQSNLMTYRRHDQETGTQYFTFYNQGIVDMPTPPRVYATMYEDAEACRTVPTQAEAKCRWPGTTFDGKVSLEGDGLPVPPRRHLRRDHPDRGVHHARTVAPRSTCT